MRGVNGAFLDGNNSSLGAIQFSREARTHASYGVDGGYSTGRCTASLCSRCSRGLGAFGSAAVFYLFSSARKVPRILLSQASAAVTEDDTGRRACPRYFFGLQQQHGKATSAIERYRMVVGHTDNLDLRVSANRNHRAAYRQLVDYADASQSYESALRLSPGYLMARAGLGFVAPHDGD